MSSNPPLDLGSLADVESPEVVKEALRTFRRRSLRTAIWVVLVVVMIGIPVVRQALSKSFEERVAAAPGIDVGTVYTSRGVTMVLSRVAALDDGTALHLVITPNGVAPDARIIFVHIETATRIANSAGPGRVVDGWFVVNLRDDGLLKVTVSVDRHCEVHPSKENPDLRICGGVRQYDAHDPPEREFTIDLKAAGVPERLWRKGEVR
jgi:hypothetical protein